MLTELIRSAEIKDIVISERMKVYDASFKFDIEKAPTYSYFLDIIQSVPQRDKIKITLQDEDERFFDFSVLSEEKYNTFITDTLEDETIDVKLRIDKAIVGNHFSIYSFDEFIRDILSLPIEDVMIAFSSLFKQEPTFIIFDVYSPIPMFATKTMFFLPHGHGNGTINTDFNRIQRVEDCKEVSYFYNFDTYEVIPDDFKITIDFENNPLKELFQKIMVLLSISFIATSSTISANQLKGIISGQRSMEYSCEISRLPDNKHLYGIYKWIYTDGNPIDKAIIARNVISLHCKYVPITEIDDKVMASIQSNYNLYLKDNVKEYLELRNKVAEFIKDIVSKTGEYATGLLDKFKTNIVAIFGFIFTIVLANIVSAQPLDNLFTKEITILIECVLLGSFVYLIICYLQSRYEIQKAYDSYEQLKLNYKEILTEDDLLEVFENDEMINKMRKTISRSGKIYLSIWIIFLIGAFIIAEIISVSPTYQSLSKVIQDISNSLQHMLVKG